MDITRRATLLAALLTLVIACGGTPAARPAPTPAPADPGASAPAAFPATVVDFQGRSTVIVKRPERIVSIGPSNTEFLFALGAGDRVVGVDDFSDEPAAAKQVEKVGGVKVNVEKVVSLRPDLVISVLLSDGTFERIGAAGIPLVVVDPQRLSDVPRSAVMLGTAIGAGGQALASDIDRRLQAVRERASGATARPRVFHEVDASDPSRLFTVGPGSFIADIIELAGGINVAARAASAYPQLSVEEIVRADPEVIVLGDADYGTTAEQVKARPGWAQLTAVRAGRIHPISDSLVSRPGPRVAAAAEAYAKILHPDLFR